MAEYINTLNSKWTNRTGWPAVFVPSLKLPIIADRIFSNLSELLSYVNDPNSSAVEGLVVTVVNDLDNNGIYYIESVVKNEDPSSIGKVIKVGITLDIDDLRDQLSEMLARLEEGLAALNSTLKYKDTYNTIDELPDNPNEGDTYRIKYDEDGNVVNKEVVWIDGEWEELGLDHISIDDIDALN